MGGRGAASGLSVKGIKYGNEYVSIIRVDNIKYVKRRDGEPANMPLETMSQGRNRVYVLVNNRNMIKSIGFYDKTGKLKRWIDLDHDHGKGVPHVHIPQKHLGLEHSKQYIPLTKRDRAYSEKIIRVWKEVQK
jgi:hypothetical protein